MTSSLYSPSWYRVAGLKPRLRSHAEIHRHHYRGDLWYVLQDHASGRFQRFTPAAYQIIGLMDGKRTVQEIWDTARLRLGDDAPTQEEVIRLLSQLHAVDALQTDVMPDTSELLKRFEKRRYGKWKQNLRSPLFMRFPGAVPHAVSGVREAFFQLGRCHPLARHGGLGGFPGGCSLARADRKYHGSHSGPEKPGDSVADLSDTEGLS